MSARTSSTRQTVVRGPSFTGLGYRPVRTPSHQLLLLMGIGLPGPIMADSLTKPVCGQGSFCTVQLHPPEFGLSLPYPGSRGWEMRPFPRIATRTW
jgi:hypothetical protein